MKQLTAINRRFFLRGVGASLALPSLECMGASASGADKNPERFLAVHVALGLLPQHFFPKESGTDYETPELLKPLEKNRKNFTVFSGLDHPEVGGGHRGIVTFLTGTDVYGQPGYDFKNTVSLDQVYAQHVGSETRFSSLQLATSGNRSASSWDVSWSPEGIALQPMSHPRSVFSKLFENEKLSNEAERAKIFERRTSLLDRVMDQAKSLDQKLGESDREKLDEYLTSVREVELRIEKAEEWAHRPKPQVDMKSPEFNSNKDIDMFENMEIMYRLIELAFQTDSTRSIVLQIPANNTVFSKFDGVSEGYHALSHHGKRKEKIEQLVKLEKEHTRQLSSFLTRLESTKENGQTMLDSTSVLLGSGLGNASSHSNRNLPVLLAGGGYQSHGNHLAYTGPAKRPLSNLYLSMLQKMGVETEQFSGSTGTLTNFA